jgi:methyltransferase (TIGR00027 family)
VTLSPLDGGALATGEPSRTAQGAALLRAAHQLVDRPLVFEDPIAPRILGAQVTQQIERDAGRFQTTSARSLRAFLVMRSRYAEDQLARRWREGTTQYIVLGAGLDRFAYRNPHGNGLQVFEVDHPATQAWKRTRLQEEGIELPSSLAFVPMDFEKDSLDARLRSVGFHRDAPVFISWLGVSMYLTREAVMQTLRFVAASCARGSEIVFDFSVADEALGEQQRATRAELAQRVAGMGEPFVSHFDPVQLAAEVAALGFSATSHFGAREANERYFAGRTDGFAVRGSTRIMTARV